MQINNQMTITLTHWFGSIMHELMAELFRASVAPSNVKMPLYVKGS